MSRLIPKRGVLRRNSLERRLFGWLLGLVLVPSLLIVAVSLYIGSRSVEWIGTLGPWDQVAESGGALITAATPAARTDTSLAHALLRHQADLSTSVTQARRWSFLGQRLLELLPWALGVLSLLFFLLAYVISRKVAKELARPIGDLVQWAGAMAEGQPLPASLPRERREVNEVRTLRHALRHASMRIEEARSRALELERVRAWGEMARRVAHEMKNPLTPLRLALHRLARLSTDEQLREPLAVIDEETGRLEELARQFAALGRPSSGQASDIDMAELIEELLRTDVPAHIAVRVSAARGLPLLHGYYDALQRACRNLVRNAVEAIEQRRQQDVGFQGEITAELRHEGEGLVVCLRDNGCGIPADRVEHIFEPDFTLKAGGTGLGLALVRQAVLAHEGQVTAQTLAEPRRGAEFVLRLPLRRAPNLRPSAPQPPGGAAGQATHERERVE